MLRTFASIPFLGALCNIFFKRYNFLRFKMEVRNVNIIKNDDTKKLKKLLDFWKKKFQNEFS